MTTPDFPPKSELPSSFAVSTDVQIAFANAASNLAKGQDVLETDSLLNAIMKSDAALGKLSFTQITGKLGITTELLQGLSKLAGQLDPAVSPGGSIKVQGIEVAGSRSLTSLLSEAQALAGAGVMDTGHILLADISRTDSVIMDLFKRNGQTNPRIKEVFVQHISALRKNDQRAEIPLGDVLIIDRTKDNYSTFSDLLVLAKQGKFVDRVVKPEWVRGLVGSLVENDLTVIGTEHESEGELLMEVFAQLLSQDMSGTFGYRGIFVPDRGYLAEDKDGALRQAIIRAKGGILVLPNIQDFLDNRSLQTAIYKRQLKVVGITSEAEWKKFSISNSIAQGIEPLRLDSPTEKEAVEMMMALRPTLEEKYRTDKLQLTISDDAVKEAVRVANRYIGVLGHPVQRAVERLIARAATNLQAQYSDIALLHDSRIKKDTTVDPDDIVLALFYLTGIEVQGDNSERFLHMEDELRQRVIGQEGPIKIVSDAIRRAKAGLNDPRKPIASFLFLGPTGVGKTELGKALSEMLFGSDDAMTRFDMSEFQQEHMAARLMGSPVGYRDSEVGGQLTEAVRKKPYSILMFDEVEKAHPMIWDNLLQILGEGRYTDARGNLVDFRNTVIIMTGNIGSELYPLEGKLGTPEIEKRVIAAARGSFRPEFFNRINDVVVFRSLKIEDLPAIVDIQMRRVNKSLAQRTMNLAITPEVTDMIVHEGFDPALGARPLERAINKLIERPLSVPILNKTFKPGDKILASVEGGVIKFSKVG